MTPTAPPSTLATTAQSTFRMQVAVSIDIAAPAAAIWALLTDPANQRVWNSTLNRIDGDIREGGTVELVAKSAPDRTFKLKVSDLVDQQQMTWSDGFAPMFRGVRTFRLSDLGGGTTRFAMDEVYSGLMLPMIKGSLPDLAPVFDTYAADLKRAAEAHSN
jgi:hypothetical protein